MGDTRVYEDPVTFLYIFRKNDPVKLVCPHPLIQLLEIIHLEMLTHRAGDIAQCLHKICFKNLKDAKGTFHIQIN